MSCFGTNIKKIRQVRGLSQKAFADLFDLNRGVISAYEEGRAEPKIETLLKVARYFNLDLDKFLTTPLQVNELVSSSDIDYLMFTTDLSTESKSANSGMTENSIVLQKILANIDLVYEFGTNSIVLPNYHAGDILFLKKTDEKRDLQSTLLTTVKEGLQYISEIPEKERSKKTLYKIVGYVSTAGKNILSEILERIENLERK